MSRNYYVIGAEAWQAPQYESLAKGLASHGSDYVVVSSELNGANPTATNYKTREQAATAYDLLATNPGRAVYVSFWDKTGTGGANPAIPVDSAFFVASQVVEQVHTKQSAAGWVAAAVGALFGLMAFGGRKNRNRGL